MPKTIITLPCTAQELESALHAVCDTHGFWNGRIDTMCDGSDSGDACVSIVLSEGSGETSPSPSTPTSPAPTESITNIIAFLRKCLDVLDTELTRESKGLSAMSAEALLCPVLNAKASLDHIEAAWKREKAAIESDALAVGGLVEASRATTEKSSAVGNVAALCEALEYLLKERDILDLCHNNLGSKTWEDWDKVYNVLRKIIEKAMRVLNKPLRNCDLYGGDYKMLHTAWFDWTGSPSGQNPDGTAKMAFGEWLLAPAIKKGDAK